MFGRGRRRYRNTPTTMSILPRAAPLRPYLAGNKRAMCMRVRPLSGNGRTERRHAIPDALRVCVAAAFCTSAAADAATCCQPQQLILSLSLSLCPFSLSPAQLSVSAERRQYASMNSNAGFECFVPAPPRRQGSRQHD